MTPNPAAGARVIQLMGGDTICSVTWAVDSYGPLTMTKSDDDEL
jgi:hypothetical protein